MLSGAVASSSRSSRGGMGDSWVAAKQSAHANKADAHVAGFALGPSRLPTPKSKIIPVMSSSNWVRRPPNTWRAKIWPSSPFSGRSWSACVVNPKLPAKISGSTGTRLFTEGIGSPPLRPMTDKLPSAGKASPRLWANNSGNRVTSTQRSPSAELPCKAPRTQSSRAALTPAEVPARQTSNWARRDGARPSKLHVRPREPRLGEGKKKPLRILAPLASATALRAASCAASTANTPRPIGSTPTGSIRLTTTPKALL
mmetsp:Transcript_6336/g.19127  ORF Transcript_6336/g.19127 Transcript_6336/m.19127 type:complete len:256 (-) Transcript_6336:1254-2021(-)